MIGLKRLLGSIIKNLNKVLKNMKYFLLVIYASLLLAGCSDGVIPAKFLATQKHVDWYEVHFQEKAEKWNDPDVLAHPRAQFLWTAPGREMATIWSMRLNGTDLRETANEELLSIPDVGGYSGGIPVQRSPSGRYLAITRSGGLNKQLRLIDLETRQVDLIPNLDAGDPGYVWVNDHIILFNDRSPLKAYDVLTKEVIDLSKEPEFKDIKIARYFVRDSRNPIAGQKINKELILVAKTGVTIYDYESRKLVGTLKGKRGELSKDGNYWIRSKFLSAARKPLGGPKVYAFDDVTKALGQYGRSTNHSPMIINDINTLYAKAQRGLSVGTLNEPKVTFYTMPGDDGIANFSLYNVDSIINK
jgi:hypothetical protein